MESLTGKAYVVNTLHVSKLYNNEVVNILHISKFYNNEISLFFSDITHLIMTMENTWYHI